VQNCSIVVCGDFNIHVDQIDDTHAVRFEQLLLQSCDLVQHVKEPTHSAGHALDLVITRNDTDIGDVYVGGMVSDHALIRFSFPLKKPMMDTTWVTNRAWRRLSHDAFASDLTASTLYSDPTTLHDMSADDLVYLHRDVLTVLLDRH